MILVSSIGLAVNLMGLFFFHDHRHIGSEEEHVHEPKKPIHNHTHKCDHANEHKHSHEHKHAIAIEHKHANEHKHSHEHMDTHDHDH